MAYTYGDPAIDRKLLWSACQKAYWTTEINAPAGQRRSKVVRRSFTTKKPQRIVIYIANARQTAGSMTDRIYPQFATHNAHTVAAVLANGEKTKRSFEFQRLHGMGRDPALTSDGENRPIAGLCPVRCPLTHLMALSLRRLLENGAKLELCNSRSSMNDVAPSRRRWTRIRQSLRKRLTSRPGPELYAPARVEFRWGSDLIAHA